MSRTRAHFRALFFFRYIYVEIKYFLSIADPLGFFYNVLVRTHARIVIMTEHARDRARCLIKIMCCAFAVLWCASEDEE